MKLAHAIIALSALTTSVVFAGEKKEHKTPNCEVTKKDGKVVLKAVENRAKCKGKFLEAAATSAPAAEAAAPAAAPAAEAPAAEHGK